MKLYLSLLALLAGAFASCTQPGDDNLDITFDPCEPLALVALDATEAEAQSLDEAASMWRDAAGAKATRVEEGGEAATTLHIRFERGAAAFHGVYEDEIGEIVVNRELDNPRERAITIAHEMGHAFGLFHITGRDSVMNPGNSRIAPNAEDARDLAVIWGECGP